MRLPKWLTDVTPRQTAIRVLITVACAFLLAVGFSMLYTKRSTDQAKREAAAAIAEARREAAEADRQWCDLLRWLDDVNSKQPPSSNPDVAEYRRLIHERRVSEKC